MVGLLSVMVMLAMSMLLSTTPLSTFVILFLSSIFSVVLMAVVHTNWYSYLLFLVYVGGLLVLFMFIVLVSSNSVMKMNLAANLLLFLIWFMVFSYILSVEFFEMKKSTCSSMMTSFQGFEIFWVVFLLMLLLGLFLAISEVLKSQGRTLKISYD
uniref:NADH dehydrogenase subunit 6 n=1 Tax=Microceramus pontificus TaxID=513540 RepID=A0A343F266_9EUPU|nr:NADH dehydrogenase subunit 6 [Microceramus pontificus]ASP44436.1 NADH dehydrogenase subunit 6 [Microceramus pontificus]